MAIQSTATFASWNECRFVWKCTMHLLQVMLTDGDNNQTSWITLLFRECTNWTQIFMRVFTRIRRWSLSWVEWMQSTSSYPIILRKLSRYNSTTSLTRTQILTQTWTDIPWPMDLPIVQIFSSQYFNILCFTWLRCWAAGHSSRAV
jgi:hypothetical protein